MNSFENFLLNLINFEKSRNVNYFKEYNLSYFDKLVSYFNKFPNSKSIKFSIVGTNGKGSVSTILAEILNENYTIGLYTSPHLITFTERIRINLKDVSLDFLDTWLNNLNDEEKNLLSNASYFEILTLVAMIYFEINQVEFQIIEAGLGGRLDATKCFYSDIIVITKIDLDHVEILGDTIEKILIEKLGIITESTKMIFYMKQDCITNDIINNYLNINKLKNIDIYEFEEEIENYNNYLEYNYKYCNFILEKIKDLYKLKVNRDLLVGSKNLNKIKINGRMEIINLDPFIIYDVSHNPSGIYNLLVSITKTYPMRKWDIVLGVLGDKDIDEIIIKIFNFSIINKINLLKESPFSDSKIDNKRLIKINNLETDFSWNREKFYIVTGSFRLFPIIKRILANYK